MGNCQAAETLAAEIAGCCGSEGLGLEAYSPQGLDVFLRRQAGITYSSQ